METTPSDEILSEDEVVNDGSTTTVCQREDFAASSLERDLRDYDIAIKWANEFSSLKNLSERLQVLNVQRATLCDEDNGDLWTWAKRDVHTGRGSRVPVSARRGFVLVPCEDWVERQQQTDNATAVVGYVVPESHISLSTMLSNLAVMFDELQAERDDTAAAPAAVLVPVPILRLRCDVLRIVAAYLVHFGDCAMQKKRVTPTSPQTILAPHGAPSIFPEPYPSATLERIHCSLFEYEVYLELRDAPDPSSLTLGVMHAANYLGMRSLVDLAGLVLALGMKKKSPQEITEQFAHVSLPTVNEA